MQSKDMLLGIINVRRQNAWNPQCAQKICSEIVKLRRKYTESVIHPRGTLGIIDTRLDNARSRQCAQEKC